MDEGSTIRVWFRGPMRVTDSDGTRIEGEYDDLPGDTKTRHSFHPTKDFATPRYAWWRSMGRTVGAYRASIRFEMSNDDARDFWAAIVSLHRRRMIRRHLRACAVARSRVLS